MNTIRKYKVVPSSLLLIPIFLFFCGTSYANAKLKNPQITQEQYNQLQKANTPIFLAFNATWCPHCRKQDKSLFKIRADYEDKAAIYSVNWDKRKKYNIPMPKQRTTIVYIQNNKIIDQLIGEVRAEAIKKFLDKHLSN